MRTDMQKAFAAAFEKWEREWRANPSAYMSRAEADAMPEDTVSDLRARCFISYLNELANGKPWDQIGIER
jgi:hypothetical protein